MALTTAEKRAIEVALSRIPLDHPSERVEAFVSRVLHLTPAETQDYFPDPDPQNRIALTISQLTRFRGEMLASGTELPTFVVRSDNLQRVFVEGLRTYLARNQGLQQVLTRLEHQEAVRTVLLELQDGNHLEALSAAILASSCRFGCATQRSGDQGIDALGWDDLLPVERAFIDGDFTALPYAPGERVYVLTSSKANLGNRGRPTTINPAFIRELVGGWIIQRTSVGSWREHGIQMLSPIQLVLATTYRLSAEAKSECRQIGVQVWGIAELVYLVIRHAPPTVFVNNGFSRRAFRNWWLPYERNRIAAAPVRVG